MNKTGIEYLDFTYNPVTGCTPVSEGCANCWAKAMHGRHLWGDQPFSEVTFHPDRLEEPLRRKKPARIGVCYMGDLFHEKVPDEFVYRVFRIMTTAKQHSFLMLTKRPDRMLKIAGELISAAEMLSGNLKRSLPVNIRLGVSVENQATADERIPLLLQTPAAVRWLSIEPMLGDLQIYNCLKPWTEAQHSMYGSSWVRSQPQIDWVIVGGESGPKARPMHPDWVRSVRDQCIAANIPFYFKQWGEWAPYNRLSGVIKARNRLWSPSDIAGKRQEVRIMDGGLYIARVGKRAAGRLLDGRLWEEMPGVKA